ncbi:undecaprenyl/decaprenyl-phosphate alpha-N-acetylglucosaminyl 1-phosphate transferase [Candidatus Peregrinibacteria bacterium]|nr:undecaprenyl/decaprenyl-phosphate alpha-N-acetylglucosaminyl 1-phosphate transferase [Candidatus Peregrinibacteria bacterium]
MQLLLPPLLSFLLTFLGIRFILRFFPKWGFMDKPHDYGLTRQPVPYSGGIIFVIVFFVGALLFVKISSPVIGLMAAAALLTAVNFADDRRRLPPLPRLASHIVAGLILVFSGVKIQLLNMPFMEPLFLDRVQFSIGGETIWLFSALVIVGWIVLMINVMNWLDGIPGLASGVSTIAQLSIFLLSIRQFNIVDQSAVIAISSIIAASTFVFLFFDFSPPKLLMGDTGSMFLCLMLGALSILAGGKLATAILIMGFPVLDAIWVIFRRVLKGGSPFKGDSSHFHHRLLHLGLTERKALLVNYLLCVLCAAIALLLPSTAAKFLAFIAVFIGMVATAFLM